MRERHQRCGILQDGFDRRCHAKLLYSFAFSPSTSWCLAYNTITPSQIRCLCVATCPGFSSSLIAVLVNNPLTNTPFILIVDLKWFEYTVYSNATSYIGIIIVIICVIVLTISLNRSNFRGKSASRVSTSVSAGEQTKDGRKEARVIKTVVFVSIVFIVCYLPAMTVTMIGTLVKEFSTVGIYRNANLLNLMIMDLFTAINASVNIFIYYFFNTRFRTTFDTVFGKLPK